MGETDRVAARAELTVASYQKCARELRPGEVKRVMQRGPLVGYFLTCPACKFVASYLDDAVGFIEDPPRHEHVAAGHRRAIVGVTTPPTCFGCARVLRVVDGFLEAVDP